MNKLKYKILSIFLIPIVLFSTSSFRIDEHICMDTVYSYSIFGHADYCGMQMNQCDENTNNSCSVVDEDCCKNETQFISGSVVIPDKEIQLNIEQIYFLTYFLSSKYYLLKSNLKKNTFYRYYSPPKVIKNLSVLYQIFII